MAYGGATRFEEIGEKLRQGLKETMASASVPGDCIGLHTNPTVTFDLPDPILQTKVNSFFIQEMAGHLAVYWAPYNIRVKNETTHC